ncbi:MAG: SPOR domain-containing protein [Steroidobacteraceae bacterium]
MKERLTGAIILVALIVLLVPELLTGPVRIRSAPAAGVTAASAHAEPPLRSYTLTLGAPPPAARDSLPVTAAPAQPAPSAHASSAEVPPDISRQSPAPTAAPGDAPSGAPASPETGSGSLQGAKSPAHPSLQAGRSSGSTAGWVVQLGSFASRRNAERLAQSLLHRGFRMSVSPARAGSRVLWRVRAGPAHDRAGAVHLAARLRALGHRGELLPVR